MARRDPTSLPVFPAEGRLRAWRVARGDPWKPAIDAARWNRAGEAVLYASSAAALAALEARAHLAPADARRPHRLTCFCVDLAPGDAAVLDVGALPADWKRKQGVTCGLGSAWLRRRRHAALLVPRPSCRASSTCCWTRSIRRSNDGCAAQEAGRGASTAGSSEPVRL